VQLGRDPAPLLVHGDLPREPRTLGDRDGEGDLIRHLAGPPHRAVAEPSLRAWPDRQHAQHPPLPQDRNGQHPADALRVDEVVEGVGDVGGPEVVVDPVRAAGAVHLAGQAEPTADGQPAQQPGPVAPHLAEHDVTTVRPCRLGHPRDVTLGGEQVQRGPHSRPAIEERDELRALPCRAGDRVHADIQRRRLVGCHGANRLISSRLMIFPVEVAGRESTNRTSRGRL
jgi:hypothetical protein